MPYDLYCFDFDGTLLDSRRDIADGINYALNQVGEKSLSEERITSFIGRGVRNLIEDSLGYQDPERVALLRTHFMEYYGNNSLKHSCLYPGIRKLLEALQGKELALVTNKPEALSLDILKKLELTDSFQYVVGGDTYEKPKPDPIVLTDIFKVTKTDFDRRLFIGDSAVDIQTAQAVDMKVCAVSYGYRPLKELKAHNPDLIAATVPELSKILLGS